MNQKNKTSEVSPNLESSLIFNFVQLCKMEGIDTESISRELEIRLGALSELKLPANVR